MGCFSDTVQEEECCLKDFENFKVARMYYHLVDRLTTKELVTE
ncbi:hypothetical protein Tco_0846695, partial [Tanacetum coccineum]